MKKISTAILLFTVSCICAYSQTIFNDDFDSYPSNDYLGPNSPYWTTWTNSDGGPDDVMVADNNSYSGSNSLYFDSPGGSGPQDVVLDFGGIYSSGRFKYSMKMYVTSGTNAYFNFQSGSFPGAGWAMEINWNSGGTFNIIAGGSLSGSYPMDTWFEVMYDMDLTNDKWEMFIDGVSRGTFTNTSSVSFVDIYPNIGPCEFWIDDVSFCTNNACNPELSIDAVAIDPNPVCTHKPADVTVSVTNHSTFPAKNMTLVVDIGPNRLSQLIDLKNMPGGEDTTFTVSGLFKSTVAGSNLPVSAINIQSDINPANDTAKTTININPSPSGAAMIKGTPFNTPRPSSLGVKVDPDILAWPDVGNYELTPPIGYTNSAYNSTWEITGVNVTYSTGATVPSSYYSFSAPAGSSNGKIVFTPDTLITD
ncbi:MAG TPA: hypothetical protein VEC12_01530, partial [Bacteroidia bacterium]|nr:hypothetical protein [Bacteroidia bacterium]